MNIYEIQMAGFPDGHITDYERSIKVSFMLYNGLNICFSLILICIGFSSRTRNMKLAFIMMIHLVVASIAIFGIIYYYKYYLELDYGIGG
jgi:hypothetical protein